MKFGPHKQERSLLETPTLPCQNHLKAQVASGITEPQGRALGLTEHWGDARAQPPGHRSYPWPALGSTPKWQSWASWGGCSEKGADHLQNFLMGVLWSNFSSDSSQNTRLNLSILCSVRGFCVRWLLAFAPGGGGWRYEEAEQPFAVIPQNRGSQSLD